MRRIILNDATLRDGSHAIKHQLTVEQIARYAEAAEAAGIPIVEVGHGNGLGASSLNVGVSLIDDLTMLETARQKLVRSKLGVLAIPGFATVEKDIKPAIEIGVDVVRIASHCTEADITQRHINYVRKKGKEVYGVLMMSHMAPNDVLLAECKKLESYGAEGVILMDSAGASVPDEVSERIGFLTDNLQIAVGFHAHNNLGMGVANSIAAVQAGAAILDGCARGFGAGAGNAQIEILVAVLEKMGYSTGVDLYKILDLSDICESDIIPMIPVVRSSSIISGLAGVFSGFAKHVERISREFGVDPRDIFFELGKMRVIAGQEDKILEVAVKLAERNGVIH